LRSLKGFELLGANQREFIITLLTGAAIALLGLARPLPLLAERPR
jgi:hypothetical protein